MLQTTNVVHADGTRGTNEYYSTGMLKRTSGSRTYPVEYTYDPQGRMKTMKTWKDFAGGQWLGVLVFCAASRRLRARDQWIGWTEEQRRRRLPLLVNNCRFLLLPDKSFPNLGSRSLRLTLDRLCADWQDRYGHPVVLVETFSFPADGGS